MTVPLGYEANKTSQFFASNLNASKGPSNGGSSRSSFGKCAMSLSFVGLQSRAVAVYARARPSSGFLFQSGNLLGEIAGNEPRIGPSCILQTSGEDNLGNLIHRCGQSNSPLGPLTKPSSEYCICRMSLRIRFLLSFCSSSAHIENHSDWSLA